VLAVAALALAGTACAQIFGIDQANPVPAPSDAAADATHPHDATSDAHKDAGHDAGHDGGHDAGHEASSPSHDSGTDVAVKHDASCMVPGTTATSCGATCEDCTAGLPANEVGSCVNGSCNTTCPFLQCPTEPDAGCVDVQTDPTNCGACGVSCLGGACRAGVCQPLVLASRGMSNLKGIAVDGVNVYWTEDEPLGGGNVPAGDVLSCSKNGCDGGTLLFSQASATDLNQLAGITTSADASTGPDGGPSSLYVAATFGYVLAVPTTGGSAVTLASGLAQLGQPIGIAYIAPRVVGDDPFVFTAGGQTAFFVDTTGGGCGASCSPFMAGLSSASGVAADSQNVYVACEAPGGDAGAVVWNTGPYAAHHGSPPKPIVGVAPLENPASVSADGANLWVAVEGTAANGYGDGQIVSCPLLSGMGPACTGASNPTHAAVSQTQPVSVVSDGTNVYWANLAGGATGKGSISACPISTSSSTPGQCGSAAVVLAGNLSSPVAVAQDAYAIYWLDDGVKNGPSGSRVMKLAKPTLPQ